jgi:PqqD family protein of HPr-rel-A system
MTGQANAHGYYRSEDAAQIIVRPLDEMTLIYQRRSGITHIVADPVPQILEAMGHDACSINDIAERLSISYDLGDAEMASALISERVAELIQLGLVTQTDA